MQTAQQLRSFTSLIWLVNWALNTVAGKDQLMSPTVYHVSLKGLMGLPTSGWFYLSVACAAKFVHLLMSNNVITMPYARDRHATYTNSLFCACL